MEPGREIIFFYSKVKGGVAAVVMLNKPLIDTGSANATVANLLVDENYRRMYLSRDLMRKVEEVARAAGKTQIVCFDKPLTTYYTRAELYGSISRLRWDHKPRLCFGNLAIPRCVGVNVGR